ncbi:MAG: hypothetical protein Kow0080_33920 [Candidatus Promineifilaceae bacterium]
MNLNRWMVGLGGLLLSMVIAGMVAGWQAAAFIMAAVLVSMAAWVWLTFIWVRVPEMEVFVVFNRETGAFSRFITQGRHIVLFPLEQIAGRMSTMPNAVQGHCRGAQTQGGVAVDLDWTISYQLAPNNAVEGLRPIIARFMTGDTRNFFRRHANNCLAEILCNHTMHTLSAPGMIGDLQGQFQEALAARLRPFGVNLFRVMVSNVAFPPHIQAILESAREREIYAESEARMMERLQQAFHQFTPQDLEWFMRLEQLRELGKNGVLLQMPWLQSMLKLDGHEPKQPGNGRIRDDGPIIPNPPEPDGGGDRGLWPPSA